jgi:hypothetical protein
MIEVAQDQNQRPRGTKGFSRRDIEEANKWVSFIDERKKCQSLEKPIIIRMRRH